MNFFLDREFYFNLRILGASHGEGVRDGERSFGGGAFGSQFERVLAGVRFDADAGQGEPGFRGGVVTEGERMAEPRGGEGFEFGGGLDLKQDWSAVDQVSGFSLDGPGGG